MSDQESIIERGRQARSAATAQKIFELVARTNAESRAQGEVTLEALSTVTREFVASLVRIIDTHTETEIEHDKIRRGAGGGWK
jgi:hypothetical protein